MTGFTVRTLALALLLALGGIGRADDEVLPTEKLIKEAKVPYQKGDKAGQYLIVAGSKDNGNTIFGVEQRKMSWQTADKKDILYAFIYCEVLVLPAGSKPSVQLLTRVAEINDAIKFGNVGMSKDKEGTIKFYRNASLNIRGSDAEQLTDLLYLMHVEQKELIKILKPYVDDK